MQLYPKSLLTKLGFENIRQATLEQAQSARSREFIEELYPTRSFERVQVLLSQTKEMMDVLRNPDPFPINELPDARHYLSIAKAQDSIIPLYAFVEILRICTVARLTKQFFKAKKEYTPELFSVSEGLIPLKELEHFIKSKVTETGDLRDNASPELRAIRHKLNTRRNDLRNTINRVMRAAVKDGMASDEGATIRNGRMVIPIQAEYKRQLQGFIHDVSSSGQTVYIEPVEALHLNNEIRQFEAEEQQEIERILRELTRHVRSNRNYIEQNEDTLAALDLIAAKAKISLKLNAEIPVISPIFALKLLKAFNPNLSLKNLNAFPENRIEVIPLNLELGPEEHCLVITGPNAGGKSVAMKTVGLSAIMIQCGYAIPANPLSEMPVFSSIFMDMGDDQSIENDLSTFSSRLLWMRETLQQFTPGSLILIDEAAAGTDPEEGGALFQAFIEHLLQNACKIIVTTHHGSLKIFAHEHPLAVNGSMEFDQKSLSPTYRFKKGIPGSSYAFEIAERMRIKSEVLKRSRELLGESKNKMESLILELETKTQIADENRHKFEALKTKADSDRERYQNKLTAIEKEKVKIREKALLEAKSIIDSANKRVEQAVQQIVEQQKTDKNQIKEIRKDITSEKAGIEDALGEIETQKEQQEIVSTKPPKVGDFVRFRNGSTSGELIELKGKNAVVQADGLRLKTSFMNLVKVERPKKEKRSQARTAVLVGESDLTSESVKPSLSVRGMRTEEALNEVMYYLDRAVFRGMVQVEIVHGKGDGILKSQIHAYLNERSDVKSFELAPEDHGGAGCTVVKLA